MRPCHKSKLSDDDRLTAIISQLKFIKKSKKGKSSDSNSFNVLPYINHPV